ncbi:M23 family metallopeptidase [Oerskovia flava]|uniref:M23 family metallopeptidase n=1 Tax=Oerskovia flava TaxID=2986422 RepID=UPI00223F0ADF|nr:M23 family metallopeptidase [Oerskovia sp. JB1-3-2]
MDEVVLSLPFAGRWLARNSPARRVPSHGSDLWGERYAIDFVGVDGGDDDSIDVTDRADRRTARQRDWRTFLAAEPAERFYAYGRPILAPADGTVVAAHDGEVDHEGRRSQLALVPYMLGQASRVRAGVGTVAGNHLVMALGGGRGLVALAHLRSGSMRVGIGEEVTAGQVLAECGSSGNSTQPHVHVQVMDDADFSVARGVPMTFRQFRERPRRAREWHTRAAGIPGEGALVEPLPSAAREHA